MTGSYCTDVTSLEQLEEYLAGPETVSIEGSDVGRNASYRTREGRPASQPVYPVLYDTTSERLGLASCFSEAAKTLAALRKLQPNWDSYGAEATADSAINAALDLLADLDDLFQDDLAKRTADDSPLNPVCVAPLNDGGVQLEWQGPGGDLEVQVGTGGHIEYLVGFATNTGERYTESNGATKEEVLNLLAEILRL